MKLNKKLLIEKLKQIDPQTIPMPSCKDWTDKDGLIGIEMQLVGLKTKDEIKRHLWVCELPELFGGDVEFYRQMLDIYHNGIFKQYKYIYPEYARHIGLNNVINFVINYEEKDQNNDRNQSS